MWKIAKCYRRPIVFVHIVLTAVVMANIAQQRIQREFRFVWSLLIFFVTKICDREVVKSKEIAESGVQLELVSLHLFCSWWGMQNRVWHSYGFWYERISEYIRVKKMIRTNIRIYSYEHFWHERISEYIRIKISIRTNIRINIRIENIRIFEYIRHTLDKTGTSSVLLQSK